MAQDFEGRGSSTIIDIDPWHRASLSWARRLHDSKWGFVSIAGAFILQIAIMSVVNLRDKSVPTRPVDLSSQMEILSLVATVVVAVVLLVNGLFIFWYFYISVIGAFVMRWIAVSLTWLTGPISLIKAVNWRCRLSRDLIPYFDVTSRHLASRLKRYQAANETRGLFKRVLAARFFAPITRLGSIALVAYGLAT